MSAERSGGAGGGTTSADLTANRLLAVMPASEREALARRGEVVPLSVKDSLIAADQPIPYVHFPLSAVASLVTPMEDGTVVEVATIGKEGLVGLTVFLGAETMPSVAFAQVPGLAFRLPSEVFREVTGPDGPLRAVIQLYAQALFSQVAQTAACNRAHEVRARCCRWLLMTHDRAGSDRFPLTHEFLSQMLGVRRASVSETAAALQQQGLIRYHRGEIEVVDRAGLEAASCECYARAAREYERLLGSRPGR